MLNTGTDVTRTETGNRMSVIVVKILLSFEALRVARIVDESLITKLEAPVKPMIMYTITQIIIG
jgi:hypothetical protein